MTKPPTFRSSVFMALLALVVAGTMSAHARLGWTLAACEAKYGPAKVRPVTGKMFKDSALEVTFRFEDWRLYAVWFPGSDRAQYFRYQANAPKMTNEQLEAILRVNSDGFEWKPVFETKNPLGNAISSAITGADMRSGYYQRSDGARTGTILLWAINNVAFQSDWLVRHLAAAEGSKAAEEQRIPNF